MRISLFSFFGFASVYLGSAIANVWAMNEPQTRQLQVGWVLETGLCEPETVLLHPYEGYLIVSNICGFTSNGQGYLSRVNRSGEFIDNAWVDGLNAPAGMAVHEGILYVTNLDRLQLISLEDGTKLSELVPVPPGRAFNDIAVDATGNIFVTDSARNQVLRVKSGQTAFKKFPDDSVSFRNANGLHVRQNQLYVGGEHFWKIDLDSFNVTQIGINGYTDIDGIEDDGEGGFLLSIVGGPLLHVPLQGEITVYTAPGLSSTNHAFDPHMGKVYMPTGYDNTVLELNWPR